MAHRSQRWFEVLLHEYCHLRQKLDGSWLEGPADAWAPHTFDSWMAGKSNPTPDRLLEVTRSIQLCELDCERRAVGYIKRWKLPWDVEDYVRRSNVYVLTYECSRLTRKWDRRRIPSRVPELHKLVPGKFVRKDRLGHLPDGFLTTWIKLCV